MKLVIKYSTPRTEHRVRELVFYLFSCSPPLSCFTFGPGGLPLPTMEGICKKKKLANLFWAIVHLRLPGPTLVPGIFYIHFNYHMSTLQNIMVNGMDIKGIILLISNKDINWPRRLACAMRACVRHA